MTTLETNYDAHAAVLEALPGEDERRILAYVNGLFERSRQGRVQFERQWYTNLAFYFGRQWAQWTSTLATNYARLYEPRVPPWRVRMVSNRIKPIIRAELAKITKERPTGFVVPATTDDDDVLAAQAGEAIFEWCWDTLNMARVLRQASFWTMLTGVGFVKDWYDPDILDPTGAMGSIMVERITPFHLYVLDAAEENLESQPAVFHAMSKDPEWVKLRFNKVVEPNSGPVSDTLESRFLSALGVRDTSKTTVAVKEAWIKPCGFFPEGAQVIWTGETLLACNRGDKQSPWVYEHREYPFTKLEHIPTGRFYPESTIVDLIPIQKEFNRTRSQIVEAKNRMAKPQLVAARGSVDPKKMTSEPGLVVFYTPGFPAPQPLPLQPLPAYVIQELDRCLADMQDISSQHEVSQGQTPAGVTAATAISYLQEQDDSKLAHTIASLEEGVQRLGKHFLTHVQQFWDATRTITVVGDNNQFEAYEFSKASIGGNTDFRIQAGSATPRSLAAKQAFILDAFKMGLVPPDKALRFLNMAETSRMYEEMQVDAKHAQRENLHMLEGIGIQEQPGEPVVDPNTGQPLLGPDGMPVLGEPVLFYPVNSYDNHMVHIYEHDMERKKQKFENAEEEVKQIFEQHVTMHKMRLAGMMGQVLPPGDPRLDAIGSGMMPPVGAPPPQAGQAEGVPQPNAMG